MLNKDNILELEELLKRDYIYLATDKYFESWSGYSEVVKIHTSEIKKKEQK